MKSIFAAVILSALASPILARSPSLLEAPVENIAGPAPEWDALFDRKSGWTGADGIYSIPLSGDERPGSAGATTTFFTFSDTFLGAVNENDRRLSGSTLVNNTNALLTGGAPDPTQIQFFWRTDANGAPQAMVAPAGGGTTRMWFWPLDGVVVNGDLYLFSLRLKEAIDPIFPFADDGVSLLRSPANSVPPFSSYLQSDTPLYLPPDGPNGDISYGVAILPNTVAAGAPSPDGYLYIYGVRNDLFVKKLLVARVLPEQIASFAAYQFWTGTSWTNSISAAVPVTDRVSSEFSVSPLPDGRYILVFQLDTLSNKVAVRLADSPVGPWSDYTVIYTAPETNISPYVYTYNAKAHPHLSTPERLLISFNVNTFNFVEHFTNADIYRPRFIWLPLYTPTPTPSPTPIPTATPGPTATPSPTATPPARSINFSTRSRVETGETVMIGGFIVTGNVSKKVIVRAIGPSLQKSGLLEVLADPMLEVHGENGSLIATNDDWKGDPGQALQIQATGIPPQDDLESAIVATLPPGGYTAIESGKSNGTGWGLVEVYDLDQSSGSQLANISTRAVVGTGNNVIIGGFILGGTENPAKIIIRAIGPSLALAGVVNPLADPTLELRDANGGLMGLDDNWKDDPAQAAQIIAAEIPPQNDFEAAIVVTLSPGVYTAIVAGKNNRTGVGLVEVYNLQ